MSASHTEFLSDRKAVGHKHVQQTLPGIVLGREDSVEKIETAGYPMTTCHLKGGPLGLFYLPGAVLLLVLR